MLPELPDASLTSRRSGGGLPRRPPRSTRELPEGPPRGAGRAMSVSLDGFVADSAGGADRVFCLVQQAAAGPGVQGRPIRVWRERAPSDRRGAQDLRAGRGLGRAPPTPAPVIVATHNIPDGWPRDGAAVAFVTDGIESAMRQSEAIAGDRARHAEHHPAVPKPRARGPHPGQGGPAAAGCRRPHVRGAHQWS